MAVQLSVGPEDVRRALDALTDLALVRVTTGGVRPVRPQAGLTALLVKAEQEILARQREIDAARQAITTIASSYTDRDQIEAGRRLAGVDAVRDRLVELAYEARTECLSFTAGGPQAQSAIAAERPLNQLALQRGVRIRNLYLESFRNDPGTVAYARWLARLGGESRTTPTLPMQLVVVDREVALVPLDPIDPSVGALEVRSPGVLTGLVSLFERLWENGTPLGQPAARDETGLSPQERELLLLLAQGHTDDAAARKLAVSPRSVQRVMTSINERLGALSRFQAGYEAARRGWV